ncbi:alpha/beta hydrolase [Streptomyces sp. WM6372]|uniref:alpha/beta hydrolase n=1 Tax=Streptomyces sp. WM6372 TaxID=1415555 RepID=UPI0006AEA134|nr:alpha/beta hydrolase fold domain-containing protein [Streptomyces sp. WM6372]
MTVTAPPACRPAALPPYAAPARATDLTGLPPAFIEVGSAEIYRDEDVAYANAVWRAGGQAELHVWPGACHGFDGLAPEAALTRAARETRTRRLHRLLTGPAAPPPRRPRHGGVPPAGRHSNGRARALPRCLRATRRQCWSRCPFTGRGTAVPPRIEHTRPRHGYGRGPTRGYTHVHVTLTQDPPATRRGGGDVAFAFSIPHGSENVCVMLPPEGRDAEPSPESAGPVDELLGRALDAPRESVDRLLASDDVHAVRLGRAVRAVQHALRTERNTAGSPPAEPSDPPPAEPSDPPPAEPSGPAAIDPVTHDPAW